MFKTASKTVVVTSLTHNTEPNRINCIVLWDDQDREMTITHHEGVGVVEVSMGGCSQYIDYKQSKHIATFLQEFQEKIEQQPVGGGL